MNVNEDTFDAAGLDQPFLIRRLHLAENLYFDTLSGCLQELIPSGAGVIEEDLGNGTGFATFGCLAAQDGRFLDAPSFPAFVSCGDERAHGKKVASVEDLKALFSR